MALFLFQFDQQRLAELLRGEITAPVILAGLAVAFVLGAMHALSPGHGKTIVAAYLVGTRGTVRHAILLGAMVTFTHTVSVFALGIVTLFLSQHVLPDRIYPVLGAISGLAIVWIGLSLLIRRVRRLLGHSDHRHDHVHAHSHAAAHGHSHPHNQFHSHDHSHDHGDAHAHAHAHVPEEITMGALIALAVSGGLVPCPSALVLLLSSVALGRVGFGLLLLVAFSLGLAVVLMGIGVLVLYAKHLIPSGTAAQGFFRYAPVASAAIIVCVGLLMTGISLGVVRG